MGQEIALIPIPNLAPSEGRDDAWRVKPTDNAWNEVNEDFSTSEQRRSERAPSSVQFSSSLSGLLTAMGLIFAPVCGSTAGRNAPLTRSEACERETKGEGGCQAARRRKGPRCPLEGWRERRKESGLVGWLVGAWTGNESGLLCCLLRPLCKRRERKRGMRPAAAGRECCWRPPSLPQPIRPSSLTFISISMVTCGAAATLGGARSYQQYC